MLYLSEINNKNTFDLKQTKQFLKIIKGDKYECYYKLIMTYFMSRVELVCLEWEDIDFENNTITIYHITQKRNNQIYYKWDNKKIIESARKYPLLPNIKSLLLKLKQQQLEDSLSNPNYDFTNSQYVALKEDGTRLNYNTLSRNLRYIGRDNDLPQIYLSGLNVCLDNYICQKTDYEFYRAWTRFDCKLKTHNNYFKDVNLFKNKRFITNLNDLLETYSQNRKSDMEM